jgi:antitoxin component of MazEF toxin-antitoxin module
MSGAQQKEQEASIRTIAVDYEVKVIAVAGSLRTTIPLTLAKQLSLKRGDTLLVSLVEVGKVTPVRAILMRKKTTRQSD